jgi:hypothetical protein
MRDDAGTATRYGCEFLRFREPRIFHERVPGWLAEAYEHRNSH